MAINLKKNKIYSFLFVVLMFTACGEAVLFSEYQTLEKSQWKSGDKLSYNFTIQDTISAKNLFINIRNTEAYSYSNLYVITSLQFPNGTKIVDTLQYEMTDEKGAFLGTGFANLKENKLFYKEAKVFPEFGEYTFTIYQAMRKQGEVMPIEVLEGIQDVGFSIEN